MISTFFTMLFFGALLGIFPVIFFYGGIYVNYFEYYEIKEYFNLFFATNLNMYFYATFAIFSGIAFVIKTNFLRYLYLIFTIATLCTFVPSIGKEAGDRLFYKSARININGEVQSVNLIYKDKFKIYYNTKDNKKIIRQNLEATPRQNSQGAVQNAN